MDTGIILIDNRDMIFTFEGKEHYLELSGSELRKEIASEIGTVEIDYIDISVYEGSPYRSRYARATADDVSDDDLKDWLIKNRHTWKSYVEHM